MNTILRAVTWIGLAMLVACGPSDAPPREGANRAEPRAVVTARPEAITWQDTIELGGTLEAPESVEIAARVEGAVVALQADLGDRVERGATLARITPEDFAARVAEADAEMTQAEAERERFARLVERDLATREQLEQAETRVRVAEAQRTLARRQLRDTRVVAPFDGAIAERRVSPGAFVRIGTPLFVLVATGTLRLALDVPERLAGEVVTGTSVQLEAGDAEITAPIARVSPVADPASRTFRALVEVTADAEGRFIAGRYVRARLDLGTIDDVVSVPRSAVFEVLGRSRVVQIVDGRAEPRDVELVAEDGGRAIVRGLPAASEVVSRSPGLLAPGTEVRVSSDAPPAERADEAPPGGAT